jgi:hypothetical protein
MAKPTTNEHQNVGHTMVGLTHTKWVGSDVTVRRIFVVKKGYLSREEVAGMAFEEKENGYGSKAVVDSVTLLYGDRVPEGVYMTYSGYRHNLYRGK